MLTQKQIDFFHGNGFLIMRGLYQGEELKLLQKAADAVQAKGEHNDGPMHLFHTMADGSKVYWRSEEIWKRGEIFRAVTVKPELLENIGQCVGQAFFPWNDSLVVKLAKVGAPVPWHQDPPYMGEKGSEETFGVPNFTTDIYLDHSGPDNGCVYAIDGHHLVGHVDLKSKTEEQLFTECGAKPLEMEAGDVLFHCLSTPHGSRPNRSGIQRRIFYIHYLADEVYQHGYGRESWAHAKPGWGAAKKSHIEEMIQARAGFGWETPDKRATLRFGEGGFEFVGTPKTPVRYWNELKAKMPDAERRGKKALRV